MENQPYYRPLRGSNFFNDGRSARPLIKGTVARGQLHLDSHLYRGKKKGTDRWLQAASLIGTVPGNPYASLITYMNNSPNVDTFPFAVTLDVLQRGKERYEIYCSMCHGYSGYGDGMIYQRGYAKPPSYHTERLRQDSVGHYFDVITNGYGAMPDYSYLVKAEDRWAIIAYIRAMQLSQHASLQDVPAAYRDKLNKGAASE
jgi:mono/diheme cytochrome c family protein